MDVIELKKIAANQTGENASNDLWANVGKLRGNILSQAAVRRVTSNNLFDAGTAINGYYCSYLSGLWSPSASFCSSAYIPVKPNTTYSQRHTQQIAFFDKDFNFIGGVAGLTDGAFTTLENTAYVVINQTIAQAPTQILNEGSTLLAYDKYSFEIDELKVDGGNVKGLEKKLDTSIFLAGTGSVYYGTNIPSTYTSSFAMMPPLFAKERSVLSAIKAYFDGAGVCNFSIAQFTGDTGIPTETTSVRYTIVGKYEFNVPAAGYNEIDLTGLNIIFEPNSTFIIEGSSPVKICYNSAADSFGRFQINVANLPLGAPFNVAWANYTATGGSISAEWILTPYEVDYTVTRVIAQPTEDNYNVIRNLIATLSPTNENRYEVFVPKGRWFECDLQGKNYVEIVGEDMHETVIYCDGTAANVTPSNYTWAPYANKPLNEVPLAQKHIVFVYTGDISIRNLTLEGNDLKYCIHQDVPLDYVVRVDHCRLINKGNLNHIIGIGIWGQNMGQTTDIDDCEFIDVGIRQAVLLHNRNNQNYPTRLSIRNSKFTNCGFLSVYELGSNQDDKIELLNCYSDAGGEILCGVSNNGDATIWVNGDGEVETDPQKVPYCIKINASGSNVEKVYPIEFAGGEHQIARPNCLDYIITDYTDTVWADFAGAVAGDCMTGYKRGSTTRFSRSTSPTNFMAVAIEDADERLVRVVGKGKIAIVPVAGTAGAIGSRVTVNASGKLEFTTGDSYVGIYAATATTGKYGIYLLP